MLRRLPLILLLWLPFLRAAPEAILVVVGDQHSAYERSAQLVARVDSLREADGLDPPQREPRRLVGRLVPRQLHHADPEVARVTHVSLNLDVDFATRTLGGTATLEDRKSVV